MLSVPSSHGLRFEDVVIPSEVPFPTGRCGRARWDPSEGSAFADLLLAVVSASQLHQKLRANVHTKIARIAATKFPVMNTCAKKVGGYPLPLSASGSATRATIPLAGGGRPRCD
jgi:hypothetical protein